MLSPGIVNFAGDQKLADLPAYTQRTISVSDDYIFLFTGQNYSIADRNRIYVMSRLDYSVVEVINDIRHEVTPPNYSVGVQSACDGVYLVYSCAYSVPADHPDPPNQRLLYIRPVSDLPDVRVVDIGDYGSFDRVYSVCIHEGFIYVSSQANRLLVIEAANPASWYQTDVLEGGNGAIRKLNIIDGKLYVVRTVGANNADLFVYNMADLSLIRRFYLPQDNNVYTPQHVCNQYVYLFSASHHGYVVDGAERYWQLPSRGAEYVASGGYMVLNYTNALQPAPTGIYTIKAVTLADRVVAYGRNLGRCVRSDGQQSNKEFRNYLISGDTLLFNKDTRKTISFWAKLDGRGTSWPYDGFQPFYSGQNEISGRTFIRLYTYNLLNIHVDWIGGGGQLNLNPGSDAYSIISNWFNMTVFQNGIDLLNWKVYINGELIPHTLVSNNVKENSYSGSEIIKLNVKNSNSTSTASCMSMFALFDRELNPDEVMKLYKANGHVPRSLYDSRLLHYDFETRSGRSVKNRVGDYNHLAAGPGYTDGELGIPNQSTNVVYRDSYTLKPVQ